MQFYNQGLFHIYNQGNNRQQVFFSEENYKYFIWKMRSYLPQFGDLIAWCLMPNHFHFLFSVTEASVPRKQFLEYRDKIEYQRRIQKYGSNAKPVENKFGRLNTASETVSFNEAIGILLKSYTKALNKQQKRTGSLFRQRTKAKDGWIDEFIAVTKANGKLDHTFLPGNDYAYNCLCYIHQNPVVARLVENAEDWPYSSARDYAGLREGDLCNLGKGQNLINFL